MNGWLTIDEAAKRVHRAPGTIRRWVRDGDLRQFPSGRVVEKHLLETDRRMRAKVGGRPKAGTTVPLVLDGRQVGHIVIRPDGEISGRIESA